MKILIVEDDQWYAEYIRYAIKLTGSHEIIAVENAKDLFKVINSSFDIVSLDYSLPDSKGKQILERIKNEYPKTDVIIISGQEDIDTAIELLKKGASDYIVKNEDTKNRIVHCLNTVYRQRQLTQTITILEEEVRQKYDFNKYIIGKDKSIHDVIKLLQKGAESNINVSISGETGTGKELAARSIHFNSSRAKKNFVAVNLASLPENLIESELFGHTKGSFTGAISDHKGKFEEAHGGTIFLDEIAEIPEHIQVKLLRVLQEKEITRIGSNKPVQVDCRIISATNKNLREEVKKGNFREDLYYRLIGLPIHLPSLRDRGRDKLILAQHFIRSYGVENSISGISLNEEAINKLIQYNYPGNVRELKSVIELACVLAEDNEITSKDIVFHAPMEQMDILNTNLTLKEINMRIIQDLMQKHNNNVRKVAKLLDIGKSTIYRLLKNEKDPNLFF